MSGRSTLVLRPPDFDPGGVRVLVVYGSKRGGTAGLAEMLGRALVDDDLEVEVRPAAARRGDLAGYGAVIIGGALYMNRWHRSARRFTRAHRAALASLPVWMFSSGPLDDSATAGDIQPVAQVSQLMAGLGARGHLTLGGRLTADANGFPAHAMAKKRSGDWRNDDQVRRWSHQIVTELADSGTGASQGGAG